MLALAFRLVGWGGVAILTGLAAGATIALLGIYLGRGLPTRAALIFLIFVIFGMAPSLLARPHVFALPILTVWTIGLLDARAKERAPSPWLLPLMLVWANAHASFVMGLALLGPFALEALVEGRENRAKIFRSWALFGVAALLVALINPQGLQGVLYPFQVMNMTSLPLITEWQSVRFDKFTPFQAVLFEGLFFTLWLGVRMPTIRLLVLLGLLYLALSQVRQQIIFVVLAALLLRDPFALALKARFEAKAPETDRLASRAGAIAVAVCIAAAFLLRLALPLDRGDGRITPNSALAAVPAEVRKQRVLNAYNFGGYLIFKGVPTFIDGRSDMYGDAFVARYKALRSAPVDKLAKDLDAERIGWTMLEPGDPLILSLDKLAGWRRLYEGEHAVVHARSGARRAVHPAGAS